MEKWIKEKCDPKCGLKHLIQGIVIHGLGIYTPRSARSLMFRLEKMFILLYVSALLLSGCAKKNPPAFERPPSAVIVAPAVVANVPIYLDEVGRSVAREVVSVQPEVSGRIMEIHFTDGANLKKGDALFTI